MRLINTQTMALKEFIDSRHAPPYAILSHAWEAGEVKFQDFDIIEAASEEGFRNDSANLQPGKGEWN
jgi:hypothetical protein